MCADELVGCAYGLGSSADDDEISAVESSPQQLDAESLPSTGALVQRA
jgi:hypothetical protein